MNLRDGNRLCVRVMLGWGRSSSEHGVVVRETGNVMIHREVMQNVSRIGNVKDHADQARHTRVAQGAAATVR